MPLSWPLHAAAHVRGAPAGGELMRGHRRSPVRIVGEGHRPGDTRPQATGHRPTTNFGHRPFAWSDGGTSPVVRDSAMAGSCMPFIIYITWMF